MTSTAAQKKESTFPDLDCVVNFFIRGVSSGWKDQNDSTI
jgi:hypothetical protein